MTGLRSVVCQVPAELFRFAYDGGMVRAQISDMRSPITEFRHSSTLPTLKLT